MKRQFSNFISSMPIGPRILLLTFALLYPLALIGQYTHSFELYAWLGLSPSQVWHGQVWRMASYGFLAGGPVDWALSLFWLATLVAIVGRNWSGLEFWGYCVLGNIGGALPVVLLKPTMQASIAGSAAMIFALLIAWAWFYRNERLILLGIGEVSVRQAAMVIALINSLVLFFCVGWFLMLAMWCGGVAGWLYIIARLKLFMGKTGQQIRSERVARLEL